MLLARAAWFPLARKTAGNPTLNNAASSSCLKTLIRPAVIKPFSMSLQWAARVTILRPDEVPRERDKDLKGENE